jgi:hypothetical protein
MSHFKKVARTVVLIMLVWPIGHMMLSSQGLFSPWRFFGWGMYATIHPKGNQILIVREIHANSCSTKQAKVCSDRALGSSVIFCSDLRSIEEVTEMSRSLQYASSLEESFELYSHIPSERVRSLILDEVLENLEQFNAAQIAVDFAKIVVNPKLSSKTIVSKAYSWNPQDRRWDEYCVNEKAMR